MKRFVGVCAVLGSLTAVAAADLIHPAAPESASMVIDLEGNVIDSGDTGSRVLNENFDNWRAAAQGGSSNLLGLFATGTNEVGDDLSMVNVGAGWLSAMGLSVGNVNGVTGSALTGGAGTIRFYQQNVGRTFIGGFNFTLPALNLAPGQSSRISFADGALLGLNLFLPSNIYATIQYTSLTGTGGFTIANGGVQIRGPINTGTSGDTMWNRTAGTDFNFSGSPLANEAFFIKSDDVPEPASIGLLILGGLALARRR